MLDVCKYFLLRKCSQFYCNSRARKKYHGLFGLDVCTVFFKYSPAVGCTCFEDCFHDALLFEHITSSNNRVGTQRISEKMYRTDGSTCPKILMAGIVPYTVTTGHLLSQSVQKISYCENQRFFKDISWSCYFISKTNNKIDLWTYFGSV